MHKREGFSFLFVNIMYSYWVPCNCFVVRSLAWGGGGGGGEENSDALCIYFNSFD